MKKLNPFSNMMISGKLLLLILGMLLITVIIITVININNQNKLVTDQEQQRLENLYTTFIEGIRDRERMAVALATSVAEMSAVQQAMAEQDRDTLRDMLLTSYQQLDEKFGVPQSQFHLPPATSFLRLHKPENFGDDLSAFRNTVLATNSQKQAISGLEKGKGGYGIRGVVPVSYQGQHVGSFEMGMNFDQQLLDNFKKAHNVDISVYWYEADSKVETFSEENLADYATDFVLFASTMEEPPQIETPIRQQVYNTGEAVVTNFNHQGVPLAIMSAPIKDFANDVVGIVEIDVSRTVALTQITDSRNLTIAISTGIFLIMALVAWLLFGRLIVRPIQHLTAVANSLAQGDINVQVDHSSQNDEIGILGRAIEQTAAYINQTAKAANRLAEGDLTVSVTPQSKQDILGNSFVQMIAGLRSLVGQTTNNAGTVNDAADRLARIAEQTGQATAQIADSTQEQATSINRVSQITSQISITTEDIAANTQSAAEGAAEAARIAQEGSRVVEETIAGMGKIKAKVGLSAEKVTEMGQRSEQVGGIVQTIDEIASQTNLLALNAAIEAARAGEHGKGFAVVADEVRKLAEKSAQATREIAGLIRTIQNTVSEAVTAMNEGSAEVAIGVMRANKSGEALHRILDAAQNVHQQVKTTANATQQMRSGTRDMVNEMNSVSAVVEESSAMTQEIAAQAGELRDSAHTLNEMSTDLQQIVSRFNLNNNDTHDYAANQRTKTDLPAVPVDAGVPFPT
jgi:methyl-accepting chemotaxis protein